MAAELSKATFDKARLRMLSYLQRNGITGRTQRTYYTMWKEYLRWCRANHRDPSRAADDFLLTHVNNAYFYALKHGYAANKWPFKVNKATKRRIRLRTEKPPDVVRLERLPTWEEVDTLLKEFPRHVPLDPTFIDPPYLEEKLRVFLSEKDKALKERRLEVYWIFLFFQAATGMRFHDAYHVRHIVVKQKYIALSATTKGGREKNYIIREDTLRKHLPWLLPHFQRAQEILRKYKQARGDLTDIRHLLVATGGQAQELSYSAAYVQYYGLLHYTWNKAAADRTTTPHDIRRAVITTLLKKGAPLPAVQRFVQHAKVETTARYFVGSGDEALRWLSS